MLSPFPGMDPYLEDPLLWPDFHQRLASEIGRQLTPLLRPRYFAALEPRVVYEPLDAGELRIMFPDVGVMESPPHVREPTATYAQADVSPTPAPLKRLVPMYVPVKTQTIFIRDRHNNRLVTVIKILSPANKRPNSYSLREYHRKRLMLLQSEVHLLEIDLLRKGERPPLEKPLPDASYFAVLSRTERRPVADVWPIRLQGALPILPVPLLEPDPDVPLELGRAVASVYKDGAFDLRVDYREPLPGPPLSPENATWVENLLREKGLRQKLLKGMTHAEEIMQAVSILVNQRDQNVFTRRDVRDQLGIGQEDRSRGMDVRLYSHLSGNEARAPWCAASQRQIQKSISTSRIRQIRSD
jgi:hypothetical protein